MRINGKTLNKISLFGTKRLITLKLAMQYRLIDYYQIYSNDDTGMTLTYFMAKSYLFHYAFVWEKDKNNMFVYDIKVGRCFLFVLRLNVPVNNFSVMSGRSHRFLGN